jgi:hypothetical protein
MTLDELLATRSAASSDSLTAFLLKREYEQALAEERAAYIRKMAREQVRREFETVQGEVIG